MSTPYEIRTNDVGKSRKQSMAELKLRRLTELNQRLQEDLNRRRIPVSEASMEYVLASHQQQSPLTFSRKSHCFHRQRAQGLHGTQSMGTGMLQCSLDTSPNKLTHTNRSPRARTHTRPNNPTAAAPSCNCIATSQPPSPQVSIAMAFERGGFLLLWRTTFSACLLHSGPWRRE